MCLYIVVYYCFDDLLFVVDDHVMFILCYKVKRQTKKRTKTK